MDIKELAENVKRLRELEMSVFPIERKDAMATINALVQLVGEMQRAISISKGITNYGMLWIAKFEPTQKNELTVDCFLKLVGVFDKAAPIAELAKD